MKKLARRHHSSEMHESESWAVSYADLLMVLMSFFIVFFNIDDHDGVLHKLYLSLKTETVPKPPPNREIASLPPKLELIQQEKDAKTSVDDGYLHWNDLLKDGNQVAGESLRIELQDNLYSLGEWRINNKVKLQMGHIISRLLPMKDKIHVVIIGHADQTPFEKTTRIVNNNMILATLRAGHAVKYAIDQGLDPQWVSSMGMHEKIRDTRSLTIRILERR